METEELTGHHAPEGVLISSRLPKSCSPVKISFVSDCLDCKNQNKIHIV